MKNTAYPIDGALSIEERRRRYAIEIVMKDAGSQAMGFRPFWMLVEAVEKFLIDGKPVSALIDMFDSEEQEEQKSDPIPGAFLIAPPQTPSFSNHILKNRITGEEHTASWVEDTCEWSMFVDDKWVVQHLLSSVWSYVAPNPQAFI